VGFRGGNQQRAGYPRGMAGSSWSEQVKVPVGLVDVVDLDAPDLSAYEKKFWGVVR
jgi:hypothetical protein